MSSVEVVGPPKRRRSDSGPRGCRGGRGRRGRPQESSGWSGQEEGLGSRSSGSGAQPRSVLYSRAAEGRGRSEFGRDLEDKGLPSEPTFAPREGESGDRCLGCLDSVAAGRPEPRAERGPMFAKCTGARPAVLPTSAGDPSPRPQAPSPSPSPCAELAPRALLGCTGRPLLTQPRPPPPLRSRPSLRGVRRRRCPRISGGRVERLGLDPGSRRHGGR